MNNSFEQQNKSPSPEGEKDALTSPIFADSPFPSFTVIGLLVLIVLLLQLLSGWKIVNLEQERHSLERDKAHIMEHANIIASSTLLHKENAEFEDRIQKSKSAAKILEIEVNGLSEKFASLKKTTNEFEESIDSKKEEEKKVLGNIDKLIEQQKTLDNQIAQLQRDRVTAHEEFSSAEADLKSLKENISQHDAKRQEYENILANLPKRIKDATEQIDAIGTTSNTFSESMKASAQQIKESAKRLDGTSTQFEETMTSLPGKIIKIDDAISALGQRRTDFDNMSASLKESVRILSTNVEGDFSKMLANSNKNTQQFSELLPPLSAALKTLENEIVNISKTSGAIGSDSTNLAVIVEEINNKQQSLQTLINDNSVTLEKIKNIQSNFIERMESIASNSISLITAGTHLGDVTRSLKSLQVEYEGIIASWSIHRQKELPDSKLPDQKVE